MLLTKLKHDHKDVYRVGMVIYNEAPRTDKFDKKLLDEAIRVDELPKPVFKEGVANILMVDTGTGKAFYQQEKLVEPEPLPEPVEEEPVEEEPVEETIQ